MPISRIIPQLRTTNLAASLDFYTKKLGLTLDFQYEDFYAGLRYGAQGFHLKHVDERDPSIDYVDEAGHLHLYFNVDDIDAMAAQLAANGVPLVKSVHTTDWSTRELVIKDDQGHTLYFGQPV